MSFRLVNKEDEIASEDFDGGTHELAVGLASAAERA
jgi:hypothetical protein